MCRSVCRSDDNETPVWSLCYPASCLELLTTCQKRHRPSELCIFWRCFFFFHPRNTTILWFIETGVSFCSNDSFAQTVVFIDFEHFNNIAPFEWSVLTSKLATFQMVVFTRFEHCNKFVSSTFSFLFFVIVLKTTNILKVVHHFQVVLNLCYITLTVISCRFSWISQKSLQWKFSYFLFEETIMIGWSLSIPDVI